MTANRNFQLPLLLALLTLPSLATAADIETTPISDWTGWHIGVGAGYGMVNHDLGLDVPIVPLTAGLDGIGGEGFLGTIEAGYDFQLGERFVVDGLVDFTFSGISTDIDASVLGFGGSYELEASQQISALVRFGRLINDQTLSYVLAGYTHTRWNGDLEIPGLISTDYHYNTDGLTIGGGIENVIADNITLKLEHRMTYNESMNIFSIPGALSLDEQAHVQTARMVLSYRPGVVAAAMDGSEEQWTGFRVGAGFGYSMLNHVLDLDAPPLASLTFSGIGGEGYLGTLELGADMLIGERFVAGIQAGVSLSNAKTTAELSVPGLLTADYELTANYSFDVLARAGVLTGPDVLWYGIAGWTHTKFKGDLDTEGLFDASYRYGLDGVTVGAGVEAMLTDTLSWKTEYRYTNYETENTIGIPGLSLDALSNQQSVRSVLTWRF
jgi:outer membrane immunogenic protein